MAIGATYDATLSRIRVAATGLGAYATATVEHSTDGVRWTTVRGAVSDLIVGGAVGADDYEFVPSVLNTYRVRTLTPTVHIESTTITPTLDSVWLKSVARPFLNLRVTLVGEEFVYEREDRGGLFPVVGRSLPVAVNDVAGSRQYPLTIRTETAEDASNLDLLLAGGDTLFLHAAVGEVVPAGGVFVKAGRPHVDYGQVPVHGLKWTTIQVTECAAPGPDVVGATSTCATVLATYATCADLLAAVATCADLLELVGSPTEVLVP